ncbi:DUF664 domain-containing protein [Nocardia sp. NPDC004068]|uniref:mycothiol transferase n=1 Tax=Nocardia sp. NPDC004068 TaxID=3364303 RepID=UPI0036AFE039
MPQEYTHDRRLGSRPPVHRWESLAEVIAEYAAACARSREIAARFELDDVVEHHLVGAVNLRFVYLGMIGDIARHAGHADILVEQIRAE